MKPIGRNRIKFALWITALLFWMIGIFAGCSRPLPTSIEDVNIESGFDKYSNTNAFGKETARKNLERSLKSMMVMKESVLYGINHRTTLEGCDSGLQLYLSSLQTTIQQADEFNTRYEEEYGGEILYELDQVVPTIMADGYCENTIAIAQKQEADRIEANRSAAEKKRRRELAQRIAKIRKHCHVLRDSYEIARVSWSRSVTPAMLHEVDDNLRSLNLGYSSIDDERFAHDYLDYCK